MRKYILAVLFGVMVLWVSGDLMASDADKEGAKLGKWTMDLDAAAKLAKQKKLPILLNFSGSDWCGWCKLMEKNVFAKDEWNAYAKENMIMVVLDFPQDATIVPKKYVERNLELKTKHAVEGFPTFILLDDDAETVLGRMGAGRDKTPENVIAELTTLLRYGNAGISSYSKTLKGKAKTEYLAIAGKITEVNKAVKRHKKEISAAGQNIEKLNKELDTLKTTAQEFRAAQLGGDELKSYKKLQDDLEKTMKEMTDWIGTKPERSDANIAKHQAMTVKIQKIMAEISKY